MRRWLRRVRGLLGLATIGGVAGALFGAVMALVFTAVVGVQGLTLGVVLGFATTWAGFGAVSAAGVGVVLAAFDSGKGLAELSVGRAAMAGSLLGIVAPIAFTLALTGGIALSTGLVLVVGSTASLGGLIGAGLVSTAKRAEIAALESGSSSVPSESLLERGSQG
jgi:hypothetical protein